MELDVLSTMTPSDYTPLPAMHSSQFRLQSDQFRTVEICMLGLKDKACLKYAGRIVRKAKAAHAGRGSTSRASGIDAR